jgi:hypothetical protein
MCGAPTLPLHRRNGLQTGLVRTHLAGAAASAANLAVMKTQPGSKSQQNAPKQGSELFYPRAVSVKADEPNSSAKKLDATGSEIILRPHDAQARVTLRGTQQL